ncbi:Histone deacetylase hda1 [Puccinia graminis f. sp. tritici]|uniref:Histone deacetylase hda1 n=1 Tax=Puccinia graminis f. sp. tritici TaxID=56615 RepID=A0A5B0LLI5_PUCGR|nr:Histone deacetylase hda1 [Puccinia graminis f. sp. tritici]
MGEAPPKLGCAMVASDVATETVDECLKIQSAFWKSLPRQGLSAKYELEMDGLSIPLGDVLKMHRSYDLYEAHGLCTIPSHDQQSSGLSKSYQNQIMVTDNVYDCKTLVLFMHDLGSLRNEIFTESANLKDENEALIAYNKVLMDWIRKNGYGLIDVQVLPSYLSDLVLDGMISAGFLGSTEEDRAKIQNTVKEYSYGKVIVSDKFRPSQILRSEWDKITEFIHAKLAGDLPSNGPQTNGNNLSRGTSQIASNGRQIPNGTPNGLRSEPPALPMDLD